MKENVIHALGIVRTQAGPHTAGQKNSRNLSLTDRVKTDLCKLFPASFNFVELHGRNRGNLLDFKSRILVLHVLQNREIRILHLLQKLCLLFLIQFIIILQNMKLSILLKFAVSVLICHCLYGTAVHLADSCLLSQSKL